MVCSNCGRATDNAERYCRACGADLVEHALAPQRLSMQNEITPSLVPVPAKDPDQLMGDGIGSVIMGDGFLFVGIILSAVESSVSSMLWLLLLIPAFIFYGKGFADILQAKQIRRRQKESNISSLHAAGPSPAALTGAFQTHGSGELIARPSVTERTTRQLK